MDDTISTQALHQPTFPHHNSAIVQRVKVDDVRPLHVLQHKTHCISVPSSEFHLTHMCYLFQKVLFRSWILYKYRKRFVQKFLARNSKLMQWKCGNSPDYLCYVYGEVKFPLQKRVINSNTRKAYHLYYGCQIGDQKNCSVPKTGCITYTANLRSLLRRKRQFMLLATPLMRRHWTNRISDCFFCIASPLQQGTSKVRMLISRYQNIPSVLRPVH